MKGGGGKGRKIPTNSVGGGKADSPLGDSEGGRRANMRKKGPPSQANKDEKEKCFRGGEVQTMSLPRKRKEKKEGG